MLWITLALTSVYFVSFIILLRSRMRKDLPVGRAGRPGIAALTVLSFRQSEQLLTEELARSRRYGHPLSLIVLSLDGERGQDAGDESLQEPMRQLAFGLAGAAWRDGLRHSDLVTFDPLHNRYVVILAESDRKQAEKCIDRLLRSSLQRPVPRLRVGLAQFPDASPTLEDLLNCAERSPVHCFGVQPVNPVEPAPVALASQQQVREGA